MGAPFSIAGAHLKFFVNGRLLGYVVGVPAWNVDTNWGELREIDSLVVRSMAPRLYRCTGTIQVLRGRSTGGLEGAGLTASGQDLLRQKYLTFEIQDRITQDIIFRGLFGAVDTQQWKVDPKGLVFGTFNFKCLSFANESSQ